MRYLLILMIALAFAGCTGQGMSIAPMESLSAEPALDFRNIDFSPDAVAAEPYLTTIFRKIELGGGDPMDKEPSIDRKIVYTANLTLEVPNPRATLNLVQKLVEENKGYIQRSTLETITFRIAPDLFEEMLAKLETLGKTINRNVSSEDVTDRYMNISIRLETAEKSRQRLLDILASAAKTKDVLEIERDLRRLTEEIETMKGKLRLLESQVSMATITVNLQSSYAPTPYNPAKETPFDWVRETSIEGTFYPVDDNSPLNGGGGLFGGPTFELAGENRMPEGFVPLRYTSTHLVASTADGNRLQVRQVKFPKNRRPELSFWVDVLKGELLGKRGLELVSEESFELDQIGLTSTHLALETTFNGLPWRYDVWLVQQDEKEKYLYVIEFSREKTLGEDANPEAVKTAIQGMIIN
jgi:uncharacterized protein DUF4349